ncbi:hypothetical protein [Scytonema sp. NUACC26]|uniref:hypothetical protein n=1 Tax=Scytonema sp. NUACC26 TaxID=3140176 RepID=UPI0034DBAB0C
MNYNGRPLAAFSMTEYESLTRNNLQVANFGRGKDKSKRKRRGAGFYAAAGAAGLAGAAAVGGAARYGGAAASTSLAKRRLTKDFENYTDTNIGKMTAKGQKVNINTAKNAASGGARGQLDRDVAAVKSFGSKVKNYDYKGAPDRAWNAAKEVPGKIGASAKRAGTALTTKTGAGNTNAGVLREGANRLGNVWKSGKVGKAGLIGAGALGAAGLAGAGYGAYKMMNRNKKKK